MFDFWTSALEFILSQAIFGQVAPVSKPVKSGDETIPSAATQVGGLQRNDHKARIEVITTEPHVTFPTVIRLPVVTTPPKLDSPHEDRLEAR